MTQNAGEKYTIGHGSVATQHMGQRRADVEAAFFMPYLRPGMSLLDCGCGPGSITLGFAALIAPGEVKGIDLGESQIEAARNSASEKGIDNANFDIASIYELPFEDESFDAVFSNAVFEHLKEPEKALAEMKRVLKSGGVVGLRSPDTSIDVIEPPNALLDASMQMHIQLMRHNGGDPDIGRKLRSLVHNAGFRDVAVVTTGAHKGDVNSVRWWADTVHNYFSSETFAVQVINLGWADSARLKEMASAWNDWGERPDSFYLRTWFEAVGWKE